MLGRMRGRMLIGAAGAAMLASGLLINALPAGAAPVTTFNAVHVTSAAPGAAVAATVSFRTATTGAIGSIHVAMPGFSGPAPAVSSVSGVGVGTLASTGSGASFALVYSIGDPVVISSGTSIALTVGGLANPGAAGSHTVTITTRAPAMAAIDSGNTLVAIVPNGEMSVAAAVPQAVASAVGACPCALAVDPSGAQSALTPPYAVRVATNARQGVTTVVSVIGALWGTGQGESAIAPVSGTFASPTSSAGRPPVNTWGINADGTANTWAGPTERGIVATGLSSPGPTNTLQESHVVGLNVDFTTTPDVYATTLRYVFTPNF